MHNNLAVFSSRLSCKLFFLIDKKRGKKLYSGYMGNY